MGEHVAPRTARGPAPQGRQAAVRVWPKAGASRVARRSAGRSRRRRRAPATDVLTESSLPVRAAPSVAPASTVGRSDPRATCHRRVAKRSSAPDAQPFQSSALGRPHVGSPCGQDRTSERASAPVLIFTNTTFAPRELHSRRWASDVTSSTRPAHVGVSSGESGRPASHARRARTAQELRGAPRGP